MDARHTIYLVLLIFFILCSGFFSAVDMAYSAVKKSRLNKACKNDKNAKIALKLAQNYNQTIALWQRFCKYFTLIASRNFK